MSFSIKPSHDYLKTNKSSTTDQTTYSVVGDSSELSSTTFVTLQTTKTAPTKAKNKGKRSGLVISSSRSSMADYF
jgi:hypothetical protein